LLPLLVLLALAFPSNLLQLLLQLLLLLTLPQPACNTPTASHRCANVAGAWYDAENGCRNLAFNSATAGMLLF
jgi:hypothetical protein